LGTEISTDKEVRTMGFLDVLKRAVDHAIDTTATMDGDRSNN
jgi:hypothetical protein